MLIKADIQIMEIGEKKVVEVRFSKKLRRDEIHIFHELLAKELGKIDQIFTVPYVRHRDLVIFIERDSSQGLKLVGRVDKV